MLERLARIEERLLAVDMRINGSIDDIEKHIDRGHWWRTAIIGVCFTIVVQVVAFSHYYGRLCEKVDYITKQVEGR
jgi:hypothetical protein